MADSEQTDRSSTAIHKSEISITPMKLSNEANATANQDIEKPSAWNNDDRPPDGRITAWLVVLGAWCILFCSFGWINSMLPSPGFNIQHV
jgi:hypothetical protein